MSTAAQTPHETANIELVRASLTYHYQGAPGLLSVCSDADGFAGRRFTTDEVGIAAAVRYVAELDSRLPKGIYTQVTTLREHPTKGRGGKDLAHAVTWLWADGDYGQIGHKPGPDEMPHPIDADHVREIVASSGLPQPSGWVDTGGGCNPVWTLTTPHLITDEDRDAVEQMTSALQAILGAAAYHHGCTWDTQVGNLDRLMRVPGTVNRKGGGSRPSTSYPGTGQRIDLAVMTEAITRLHPEARHTLDKAAAEKRARQDDRVGRTPAVPAPARPTHLRPAGTGIFDILAATLAFRDILEPQGWTYRGTAGDGRHKWLRPAGAEGSADSDYSLVCDDHVAVNWSERSGLPVGQQASGRKLTVPTLWAHIHYNGDEREAALDALRAAHGQDARPAARALPAPALAELRRRCNPPAQKAPAEDIWQVIEDPDNAPDPDEDPDSSAPPAARPGLLPESFWQARPVFQHMRQAAHSQGCSGDLVLYSTLSRLSGMLSHHIRAVTGIGGRASLNVFAAMVGTSGAGKSISAGCVRDLMAPPDDDFRDGLPIGTGEGIAEAFMGSVDEATGELHQKGPYKGDPVMAKVRKQTRHNAFFYVDEGQTLAKLAERTGSILGETLRRAAIGEALGQTNASEERTRYIAPGSYSLGLLAGFQPSIATVLLADAHTGTPQRFYWGWADDPAIPDEPPPWPGPIEPHPGRHRPTEPVNITFPARIRKMLWADRVARGRGEIEVAELDGHAGLMKVKLAALFALLDGGRYEVTEEDWELAEIAWESSCKVRDSLVLRAQREAAAEKQRTEDAKVHAELRSHVAKKDADLTLERVAHLVRRHASTVGGITYGGLKKALASRDRPVADKAVSLAVARGWVYEEGDRICVKTD
ncbi:hypothetical protein [Streptomyces sp. NPDC059949]|uniref:hypothetical protein n=1 Tax=Streptomyces sp. NPDC059949 TaxID=3347013 RepID=UPI00365171BF